MSPKIEKNIKSYDEYASIIFKTKDQFHKDQARLPIEEKIRILVKLQELIFNSKIQSNTEKVRQVWKLD